MIAAATETPRGECAHAVGADVANSHPALVVVAAGSYQRRSARYAKP